MSLLPVYDQTGNISVASLPVPRFQCFLRAIKKEIYDK